MAFIWLVPEERRRADMRHDSDKKESILRNSGVQTILASLLCIILGLLVGYVVC